MGEGGTATRVLEINATEGRFKKARMSRMEKLRFTVEALVEGASLLSNGVRRVEHSSFNAAMSELSSWYSTVKGGGSADEIRRKIKRDLDEELAQRGVTRKDFSRIV